jgi:hypothetical protein
MRQAAADKVRAELDSRATAMEAARKQRLEQWAAGMSVSAACAPVLCIPSGAFGPWPVAQWAADARSRQVWENVITVTQNAPLAPRHDRFSRKHPPVWMVLLACSRVMRPWRCPASGALPCRARTGFWPRWRQGAVRLAPGQNSTPSRWRAAPRLACIRYGTRYGAVLAVVPAGLAMSRPCAEDHVAANTTTCTVSSAITMFEGVTNCCWRVRLIMWAGSESALLLAVVGATRQPGSCYSSINGPCAPDRPSEQGAARLQGPWSSVAGAWLNFTSKISRNATPCMMP